MATVPSHNTLVAGSVCKSRCPSLLPTWELQPKQLLIKRRKCLPRTGRAFFPNQSPWYLGGFPRTTHMGNGTVTPEG